MDAIDVVLLSDEQPERACICNEPPHRLGGCGAQLPDDGIAFCDDCLDGDHSEGGTRV